MATDRNEKFRRRERSWERFRLREYPKPECILPHIVEDEARTHPDRVVFQFRDLPITSGELNENVNKFARGFQRLGVKRGEKVAVMKEGVTPACWDREKAGYTLRR
jgi:non-ribosomal peptide synthetase component F